VKSRHASESTRPIIRAAILLLGVAVAGTIGFKVMSGPEYSWLDAAFMTVITLTTVGYGETIPVSGHPAQQAMVIVLLCAGVGTFLYFFSNVTAFFVEGTLDRMFWRRRMARQRKRLDDHFIVIGGGHTGEHVLKELLDTDRDVVLVEIDDARIDLLYERFEREFPVIVGDGTDDGVLMEAGIERAAGLVSCMKNDNDNLLATFATRNLRPDIRIVARCMNESQRAKLKKAGANAVVSPNHIGGLRLVSELVRPVVVSFLDVMLREGNRGLRVEEVTVQEGSELDGLTVGALRARDIEGLVVVAIMNTERAWEMGPAGDRKLVPGEKVVIIAKPEARVQLEDSAAGV